MQPHGPILLALPLIVASAPAVAADTIAFDIAPGRLDRALMLFARQAGLSINIGVPGLAAVRTRGLSGRHSIEDGLVILLQGTGYGFRMSGRNVRIVRLPRATSRPVDRAPEPAPLPSPPPPEPIVVTASKRDALLVDYPGTAHVAALSLPDSLRIGARGSETLLRELPDLMSTNLGEGRNKIFIRGIADSSFNGQNQATISQYFGESRLIYSAPDPNLALYDIERVEVLEGPQGTLYGAGSLGGVIRLLPRAPDPQTTEVAGTVGLALTGGELSYDVAVMGNLPLGENSALRAVGYRILNPGYIDDPQRMVSDTNRTSIGGLRLAASVQPVEGWELEAGFVVQNIGARDGQYTNTGTSDLRRSSAIAQPFDNDYRLIYLTARGDVLGAELIANTTYVDHAIDTVFDATRPSDSGPRLFEDDNKVSLITHESRLSGSAGGLSSWVLGLSLVENVNHVSRALGDPAAPTTFAKSRSDTFDAALFGEVSIDITERLSLTGGARVSYNRQVEEAESSGAAIDLEPKRSGWRLLPTAAISWRPFEGWLIYARHHEGYRPGSQRIVSQEDGVAAVQFAPDELRTMEGGIRFGTSDRSRFYGGLTFAHSRWEDVQADLITEEGFPYLANIGSGFVSYASVRLGWRPSSGLVLDLTGFATANKISEPAPEFVGLEEGDLPNIAESGGRFAARYSTSLGDTDLELDGSIGYIGKSYLGIGQPFEREQGKYLDTTMGGRVDFGNWGIALDIDNLLDSRANRFSFGNPFQFASEDQRTPLRPRTIRIGLDAQF